MSVSLKLALDDLPNFAINFSHNIQKGDTIMLSGSLGVGKTAIARALIHSVQKKKQPVPSPSMPLVIPHQTQRGIYWHADLYRLKQGDPFGDELPSYLAEGYALLLEWPDRLSSHHIFKQGWRLVINETDKEDLREVHLEPFKF